MTAGIQFTTFEEATEQLREITARYERIYEAAPDEAARKVVAKEAMDALTRQLIRNLLEKTIAQVMACIGVQQFALASADNEALFDGGPIQWPAKGDGSYPIFASGEYAVPKQAYDNIRNFGTGQVNGKPQ